MYILSFPIFWSSYPKVGHVGNFFFRCDTIPSNHHAFNSHPKFSLCDSRKVTWQSGRWMDFILTCLIFFRTPCSSGEVILITAVFVKEGNDLHMIDMWCLPSAFLFLLKVWLETRWLPYPANGSEVVVLATAHGSLLQSGPPPDWHSDYGRLGFSVFLTLDVLSYQHTIIHAPSAWNIVSLAQPSPDQLHSDMNPTSAGPCLNP